MLRAGMQPHLAAEYFLRPVLRVVMQEPTAAIERMGKVREVERLAGIFVILAADRQREPLTGGDHDAGRPDLDVELIDAAGLERLFLIMAVPRTPRL